ncbi:MAG: hypothetical protein KAG99_04245, partial [Bacteroidales bacterium]|nr:hypothetical protein [Bacteroidales bacterium]
MRKILTLLFIISFVVTACQQKEYDTSNTIKVGVFYKYGLCPYCIADVIESLKIDKDIEAIRVSA